MTQRNLSFLRQRDPTGLRISTADVRMATIAEVVADIMSRSLVVIHLVGSVRRSWASSADSCILVDQGFLARSL